MRNLQSLPPLDRCKAEAQNAYRAEGGKEAEITKKVKQRRSLITNSSTAEFTRSLRAIALQSGASSLRFLRPLRETPFPKVRKARLNTVPEAQTT